jgi:tRNA 2-thiouridine synthesizing protein D
MTSVTIVIQNSPYRENNKAWHALRFAGAALAEDMSVRVHLLDDGVEVGRHGQQVPEGAVNLEKLLGELIECGSMKALANWVKNSDHVMVF